MKQQNSNNRKMLKRLKLATIFMPPAVAWFYETLRHSFFSYQLQQDWSGNLLAAIFVFIISLTFSQVVFSIIARMQIRLVAQNKQLKDLNQKIKVLAVTEERSRLSREMHDGLAQLLAYSMMKVDLVETLLQTGRTTKALEELELVRKACDDGYNDVREAITGLRADLLDGRDFLTILAEVLNHFSDTNPVAVEFVRTGFETGQGQGRKQGQELNYAEMTPPVWTLQLVRVVQETLSNIRKHSGATRVRVNIEFKQNINQPVRTFAADSSTDHELTLPRGIERTDLETDESAFLLLEICDNGRGFNHLKQKEAGRGHFGLMIMRERIESLGGKFEYGNQIDGGAFVAISLALPLRQEFSSIESMEAFPLQAGLSG